MSNEVMSPTIPVSERLLRELSKDPSKAILDHEQTASVKQLHDVVGPIIDTADLVDLSPNHRAAACNALCAIIEKCQASDAEHIRNAVLDDFIWIRALEIYFQRSENAKGKSMRQLLLTLTSALSKQQGPRSKQLRERTALTFVDIICQRRDRIQVKPALQGLAHFLQKEVISIADLIELYRRDPLDHAVSQKTTPMIIQDIFRSFLSWIVQHDTSLSAGHLIKNFMVALRRATSNGEDLDTDHPVSPLWIEPVVETLRTWQDRIQEFKTHVFPHCFLPNTGEYLRFLSYLHFGEHIYTEESLPEDFEIYEDEDNGLSIPEEFRILLAAIQSGKELGIIKDADDQQHNEVEIQGDVIYLRDSLFDVWLSDPEPEVRLAGLFLSVYSTASTKPISGGVFKSLKRHLVHLHTDTDANFRKEVLSQIQRLFDRLKGSTAVLARSTTKKSGHNHDRIPISRYCAINGSRQTGDALRESLEFILWYTHFLQSELRPTASYQQRVTALRSLSIVLKSGLDPNVPHKHLSKSAQGDMRWAHGLSLINYQLLRSLLDLVLDPFDDIRSFSAFILELCLDSIPTEQKSATLAALPTFIHRAETLMLRTGRADQADGVARAYSLLFTQCNENLPVSLSTESSGLWSKMAILRHLTAQLEQTIELARKDLSLAVNERPVHGTFAALRYIMDQEDFYTNISLLSYSDFQLWKGVHHRILTCFETLWSCMQDVLCADAPEGHVPEDFEEEASLDTKEILSYSWRGLKEASTLLRTVISRAPIGNSDTSLVSPDDVERLGKLCFLQLVELRHRGAFSTVAQTFAVFCRRCQSIEDGRLRALPASWYQETLLCIQDKATSITRRSAGIPSLMTGILAAEQQPGGELFPRAIKDLFAEASQAADSSNIEDSRLPQVHALNCIKEIFTTSKLSATSEPYLGDGLDLAARTINSDIWSIRNCGLMLFKALIERLLGSDEAQDWKDLDRAKYLRFSYGKYPQLLGILSTLLDPEGPLKKSMVATMDGSPMDLHGAEGVFPALQILRQAPPPDSHRNVIKKSVQHLFASPHWHLREMAARTWVSLHRSEEYDDAIKTLLNALSGSHNVQHGVLLSLKYILKKYLLSSPDSSPGGLKTTVTALHQKAPTFCGQNSCPFTKAAFVDLLNICDLTILQQRPTRAQPPQLSFQTVHAEDRMQGDALLRRALNLRILIDSVVKNASGKSKNPTGELAHNLRETLTELASNDPDTCCEILKSLGDILRNTKPTQLAVPKDEIISHVHHLILHANDPEVVSISNSLLAESLSAYKVQLAFFESLEKADILRTIENLKLQCLEGSPSNMQSALHLLGYFLDIAYGDYPESRKAVAQDIVHYIRILRMAIVDTNPFDTRYAAVKSISTLDYIWSPEQGPGPSSRLTLGLIFVLYDMLNDDDDEIRNAAALVVSKLLNAQGEDVKDAVPIISVQRLGKFLLENFSEEREFNKRSSPSIDFLKEALRRLTGTPSQSRFCIQGVNIAEARKEDTALFSQEKQNLYKDDAMDTVFWATLLRNIAPYAIQRGYKFTLNYHFVQAGLKTLMAIANDEIDGPLGWTSKPEVFILGFRVLCAADVLLISDGGDSYKVRLALRELADVGKEKGLNGIWLEKTERVLENSVVRYMQQVYGGLAHGRCHTELPGSVIEIYRTRWLSSITANSD